MRAVWTMLACLLLANLAMASPFDKVLLKDGSTVNGKVMKDTGEAILVEGNWGEKTTLTYDQIDPRTLFRLKLGATKKTDGPGQLKLARFACDIGLWAQSRRHYSRALAVDKTLANDVDTGLEHLRKTAGASVLAEAKRLEASGNLPKARELLTTIIREIPHDASAEEAAKMLIKLHPRTKKNDTQDYEVKVSPRLKAMLAPARIHYDRMLASMAKGEQSMLFPGKATPQLNSAVQSGMQARRIWIQLKNKNSSDPEMSEIVDYVDTRLDGHLVELHVHLAGLKMRSQEFPAALTELDKATRIAPTDGRVSAMKMKIHYQQKVDKQRKQQEKADRARYRAEQEYGGYGGYGGWGRLRNRAIFH